MLVALAAVPILIALAVKLSSRPATRPRTTVLDRITQNGLFVAVTALVVCVPLFLPLTVGVVAGDTIAGEANLGTLRYLLLAPSGRIRLLWSSTPGPSLSVVPPRPRSQPQVPWPASCSSPSVLSRYSPVTRSGLASQYCVRC